MLRRALSGRTGAIATTLVAGTVLWSSTSRQVHNDAPPLSGKQQKLESPSLAELVGQRNLSTIVWGSNRSGVLTPGSDTCVPTTVKWLDNVALRDLALHKKYAACVDARGDVYLWGSGTSLTQDQMPKLILKGKDIRVIQLTHSKLYALSASGKVYALSSTPSEEKLNNWSGWVGSKSGFVDFLEVLPKEDLGWGERITSIVAGDNHLLAVTSKGRTFAHPVNMHANNYSQLGMRKVEVQNDPKVGIRESFAVDLVPRSVVDPFIRASNVNHQAGSSSESDKVSRVDDKSIHFCHYFFEIPVLRGVVIEQVAAGSRSSFGRTSTGRVLAWGANEYGQLGLGSDTTLETVMIPTEVNLWRFTSSATKTRCLDVSAGGDLTSFTVERLDESKPTLIDLLMCGNGRWGGLGNNAYSTAQGTPVKVKSISGLLEYNEATRCLEPIQPQSVVISPSGHIMVTLNTSRAAKGAGRDLVVWGRNADGELGNGKRASVAGARAVEGAGGRVLLGMRVGELRDARGRVSGQGQVEQRAAAGDGNSAIYWRVVGH
ncbi:hypothetical protein APHAL10511_007036 [Amanita phalloides]|nr:hypothetical protein APHAL10511_007036 [Amanita phalloides]